MGSRLDAIDWSSWQAHDIATLMFVIRGGEVLLIRKLRGLGKGKINAPGGRQEAGETLLEAAVRETREEAELHIDIDSLRYYAHWTTPPIMPKRYATWFFVARAPADDAVTVDGSEIHEHQWVRPAEALEKRARGEIEMMPPTFVTLTELSACADVAEVLARVARRDPPVFEPHFVVRAGLPTESLYAGDAGYAESDPDVPGSRHRVVMGHDAWQYLNEGGVTW